MFKEHDLHSDENHIWQCFRKGSEKAFEQIYDRYFSLLFNYGLHISANKDLIKDCIQNLFFDLWKKRESISEVLNVKSYLFTALRRKIVKELMKENKLTVNEISENYDFVVNSSHEFSLIDEQHNQEVSKRLSRSFNTLTKRQKEAIFLRFYENMDYLEIAVVMSLKSSKYARTLIYRALDVLKITISKEVIY